MGGIILDGMEQKNESELYGTEFNEIFLKMGWKNVRELRSLELQKGIELTGME